MIEISALTKRYYSISEVSELLNIAPTVLRFWEGEFSSIQPTKGRNGIRRYTSNDIQDILLIHNLLKERGFTIEGAKKEIKTAQLQIKQQKILVKKLRAIKSRLINLRDQLG